MTYNRFIQGLGLAGVEVDRKILADLAVNDIAAFNALVEVAKAALPEDVNAPRAEACRLTTPLKAGNARLKEARKLSRRSVRTERRLFLADGPKAVEAALESGCVEEVFARAERRAPADLPDGVRVTRVEDRALEPRCPTR